MAVFGLISLLVPLLVIGGIVTGVVVLVNKRKADADSGTVVVRDVLLQLLTTATLYLSVVGVLLVIWSLAEYWFPQYPDARSGVLEEGPTRAGIAMALVAFPVFVYMSTYTKKRQSLQTIELRQTFAYINLFVVMVTVLVDLMVVIDSYLSGDLTPRFFVRAAGVLLMAALVYLYYRNDSSHEGDQESAGTIQPTEPQT